MKIENINYLSYVGEIFSYFQGEKEGQGCYLMRIIRTKYRSQHEMARYNLLRIVLFNLIQNGFLDTKEKTLDNWIYLTPKGSDYLNGGPMIVNNVDFTQYLQLDKDKRTQFDELWELIGIQDTAPFYIKGPVFLNIIKPYLPCRLPDYLQFIEDLRTHEKPTSRRIWYYDLYSQLPKDKIVDFLEDLAYSVKIGYYFKEDDYTEIEKYVHERILQTEELIQSTVSEMPELNIPENIQKKAPWELLAVATEICNSFKSVVENNRMYKLLYNDDGTPKDETAAQLLFYTSALGYCKKYNVDINRESDPGIGELDFKFSVGNKSKVVIEMKLSTNGTLKHGYEKQLPAYLRAEEISRGIFVIVQTTKTKSPQQVYVEEAFAKTKDDPKHEIDVIVVDATSKPSASKI